MLAAVIRWLQALREHPRWGQLREPLSEREAELNARPHGSVEVQAAERDRVELRVVR